MARTGMGAMDMRATLKAPARTPDGGGGFTQGWTSLAPVWIALAATGGSDDFGPDRLESRVRYRVTLRRRTDVAAGMRLVTAARSLLIRDVLDEGPGVPFLTLICEDVLPGEGA